MGIRWFPWTWLIRRAAQSGGFLDPVALLDRLRRFARPSEVTEPIELLRAGLLFHARGLVNSRAIQHNLDWVWPFWAEKQFDPRDESFLPRSFSVTHVNLTHRNWTAVGLPGFDQIPIVDPRGLVTPFYDGWSLDAWILADDGRALLPSKLPAAVQQLDTRSGLAVVTDAGRKGLHLGLRAEVVPGGQRSCVLRVRAQADAAAWAVVSLRPYNPEGVSFVHQIEPSPDGRAWRVDGGKDVLFDEAPERQAFSRYADGDVRHGLPKDASLPAAQAPARCEVGMATAAALYRLRPGEERELVVRVPLEPESPSHPDARQAFAIVPWENALRGAAVLRAPEARFRFLYDAALRSLILHSPADVYPGPYTYKRFWFRDAAFILDALCCAGLSSRAEACLERFFPRQRRDGYFLSQEGEWDSNGEALWILDRFRRLTGQPFPAGRRETVEKAADWIVKKRLPADPPSPTAGLFPAGFSAEHLGLNDHYYWDDFWGVAGLEAAAAIAESLGDAGRAEERRRQAGDFRRAIDDSLRLAAARIRRPAMPAAPERRLDSGAIGSLAASYPLRLFGPIDPRVLDTAEFLLDNCALRGGFFQDMVHSGVNPYLTLHVAQVLLRAGDPRAFALTTAVADLASETGQWPEAVHPRTGGGCMGDGHHVWASAEWVLMVRNMFVREEDPGVLVLASGIPPAWRKLGEEMSFGPAPTPYGAVTVRVRPGRERTVVAWEGRWRGAAPRIEVRLPGRRPAAPAEGDSEAAVGEPWAERKVSP